MCVINTIPVFCLFVLSFVLNISISSLFFLAREVLFDYLKGRWNKEDIQKYIKFSTVVRLLSKSSNNSMSLVIRDVVYNKATDDFTVSVKDLKRDIVMDGER